MNPDSTTPLYYEWMFNGANLPGATNSMLTVINTDSSQAGNYTVVVSNVARFVTSAPVSLTVLVPPMISTQPMSAKPGRLAGLWDFQVARVLAQRPWAISGCSAGRIFWGKRMTS